MPLLPKPSDARFESRIYNIDPQLRESSVTSESPLKRVQVQAACVACHKRKTKVCQRVLWDVKTPRTNAPSSAMATGLHVPAVQKMISCADMTSNRTHHDSLQCSGRTKAFSMSLTFCTSSLFTSARAPVLKRRILFDVSVPELILWTLQDR